MNENSVPAWFESYGYFHGRAGEGERAAPSVPAVGVLGEARTLDLDDAEALAGRRLHHHPAREPARDPGAQVLEPRDLGFDVVGLDVDVDAALVLDALNLDDRLAGRRLEHAVGAAAHRMGAVDRAAERFRPEARRRVDVGDLAIDQHGAKAGAVHVGFLRLRRTVGEPGAGGLHSTRRPSIASTGKR
jgi:hypothetical protein